MKFISLSIIFLFINSVRSQDYHVLDYGAKGDGTTDDTQAVRAATNAAANSNGGRVIFDSGYTFLTGGFNITSNVILDVRGTILASIKVEDYPVVPTLPFYGPDTHDFNEYCDGGRLTKQPIIFAYNVTNITVTGGGVIDGQGPMWWPCKFNTSQAPCHPCGRPRLFQPTYTSNLVVEHVTLKDSPFWTLHLAWTENVYINNVTITTPPGPIVTRAIGLNTDGIDIDCSVNVTIENSYVAVADDAIVVKSGWNYYGRTYGRTTENVLVRNCTVGPSTGFAIGSEVAHGAKNITFENCYANGALRAVYVKTEIGRGGIIEDVTYNNIRIDNTNVTIELNMDYSAPQNNDTSIPTMRNIIINNITGNGAQHLYDLKGLKQRNVENIYLSNIKITNISGSIASTCHNVTGTCDSSTVFPSCPPCLGSETCFDAVKDCSSYVNYCTSQAYHATLCDLCRKTCNLCNSC